MKLGREDAVESSFVRDVTVESWSFEVSATDEQQYDSTYQPATKDIPQTRRHVDILPYHIVGSDCRNFILGALLLTSVLFPDNPDSAMVTLGIVLGWVMSDHEF